MLNENLKFVFQFTLLILTQIILLDNINLFGFLNPIIYNNINPIIIEITKHIMSTNNKIKLFTSILLII